MTKEQRQGSRPGLAQSGDGNGFFAELQLAAIVGLADDDGRYAALPDLAQISADGLGW